MWESYRQKHLCPRCAGQGKLADPSSGRREVERLFNRMGRRVGPCPGEAKRDAIWATEPDVGRVANGVPKRVDRLRCLGNAVVPQVAEYIGRMIMEYEQCHK